MAKVKQSTLFGTRKGVYMVMVLDVAPTKFKNYMWSSSNWEGEVGEVAITVNAVPHDGSGIRVLPQLRGYAFGSATRMLSRVKAKETNDYQLVQCC